jgi:hypothetical protein
LGHRVVWSVVALTEITSGCVFKSTLRH